jgi:hypothetical protein
MTQLSDVEIVKLLLKGAVPERADELEELWEKYSPAIEVAHSHKGHVMNANRRRIRFTTVTIDLFWLLTFSAWRSIEVYLPAVVFAIEGRTSLQDALGKDEERGPFEFEYKQRFRMVEQVIETNDPSTLQWPNDIPLPTPDRETLDNPQGQASFDLAVLTTAFAMLHEFRHVMFDHDGDGPSPGREEELQCDRWAREFMTGHLTSGTIVAGSPSEDVLNKRAIAGAMASVIVQSLTPATQRWGDDEYPPVTERIKALIHGYNLPTTAHFWKVAAAFLTGIMRMENRSLDFAAGTYPEMTDALVAGL